MDYDFFKSMAEDVSKYKDVYKYLDDVVHPKENKFVNQSVLFANIEQLLVRNKTLETLTNDMLEILKAYGYDKE